MTVAFDFGHDRAGVRIPFGDTLTALHLVPVVHIDARTIGDAMGGALLAGLVEDQDRHVAAHHHEMPVGVAHDIAVADLHRALVRRFQEGLVDDLRRTAHVEGTHGELRAGLADRLRGDDADSLADVDRRTAGQIAAVADRADACPDLAGQSRADAHRLNAGFLDRVHIAFVDQTAGLDDDFTRTGCRIASSDVRPRTR